MARKPSQTGVDAPRPREMIETYGEDKIMAAIEEGGSLFTLAEKIGVNRSTLDYWLTSDVGRSARARIARQRSSGSLEEKAERGIQEADGPFELAKAKELAHHYRWAARVRSPATHGDKLELSGNAEAPLAVKHTLDTSALTDEQLRALAGIKLGGV